MTPKDSSRPGAGRPTPGKSSEASSAARQGNASRPMPGKAKDDISSAPESGDKPEAFRNDRSEAADALLQDQRSQSLSGSRSSQGRAKDDVSSAPESGDKPEAQ